MALINDDLGRLHADVQHIIRAERIKRERQTGLAGLCQKTSDRLIPDTNAAALRSGHFIMTVAGQNAQHPALLGPDSFGHPGLCKQFTTLMFRVFKLRSISPLTNWFGNFGNIVIKIDVGATPRHHRLATEVARRQRSPSAVGKSTAGGHQTGCRSHTDMTQHGATSIGLLFWR